MKWWVALALAASACAVRPHATTFVKKGFGFIGPRELTLVGPSDDVQALRVRLRKRGFTVFQVDAVDAARTRYVAEIAGVCNTAGVVFIPRDAELHVFVTKLETRERVYSVRLEANDDCPEAFFTEAADGITRNWPLDVTAEQPPPQPLPP